MHLIALMLKRIENTVLFTSCGVPWGAQTHFRRINSPQNVPWHSWI